MRPRSPLRQRIPSVAQRAGLERQATAADAAIELVAHLRGGADALGADQATVWGELPTPACTLIPVPCLAREGMLRAFEATAVAALAALAALPAATLAD